MSVRRSVVVSLAIAALACGGTTPQPVAKNAPVTPASSNATIALIPSGTATAASSIEANAPIDPRTTPAICWEDGDQRVCSVERFDDATLARLALLPDRDRWEFRLERCNDEKLESVRHAPFVQSLTLQDGDVTSFAALSALPQLRSLVLYRIRGADLAQLASLSKLRALELDQVDEMTDFQPLSQLAALESLAILRTGIKKMPATTGFTSLTELHLEGNDQLTSFTELSSLTKLRVLHLGHSKIASLAPIAKLTTLEDLGIELTPLLHTLKPLHALKALKHVLVSPDMPLFERAALKKSVPGVEVEPYKPSAGIVMEEKSGCYVIVPGCCLCGEQPIPCAAKK
jgi:Leucine-rich repeat (LRR) protein